MPKTSVDCPSEESIALWQTSWDLELHKSPDQIGRIFSAYKVKADKVELLTSGNEAMIYGSAATPYRVTLVHCDCTDFHIRRKPCKHIYSLAVLLGILNDTPTYNKKAASQYDFQAEINRFYALYATGIISGEQYEKLSKILLR